MSSFFSCLLAVPEPRKLAIILECVAIAVLVAIIAAILLRRRSQKRKAEEKAAEETQAKQAADAAREKEAAAVTAPKPVSPPPPAPTPPPQVTPTIIPAFAPVEQVAPEPLPERVPELVLPAPVVELAAVDKPRMDEGDLVPIFAEHSVAEDEVDDYYDTDTPDFYVSKSNDDYGAFYDDEASDEVSYAVSDEQSPPAAEENFDEENVPENAVNIPKIEVLAVEMPEEEEIDEEIAEDTDGDEEGQPTPLSVEIAGGTEFITITKRTFAEKLAEADDVVKDIYNELKNQLLSYKGARSRISARCDTVRAGGIKLAKIKITSKNVLLFLPLDTSLPELNDGTMPHVDVGDKKAFADTPFRIKVHSALSVRRAIKAIDLAAEAHGLKRNPTYQVQDFTKNPAAE